MNILLGDILLIRLILFPNNLVKNIVVPGKQGIYLENGIRSNNVLFLWLICGC